MALPLQLIIVGPLARFIFRTIFVNEKNRETVSEMQNEEEQMAINAM